MTTRAAARAGVAVLVLYGCIRCAKPVETARPVAVRVTPTTAERLLPAFRALPDLKLEPVTADGSIPAVRALIAKQVDVAMVMADVAYNAYVEQPRQLRGIAVLNVNTIYLAAAPDSRIQSMGDLRGHRVSLGTSGSATTALTTMMLEASGVGLERIHGELSAYPDTLKQLSDGRLDAAFLSLNASVRAATDTGARLIPIDGPWIEPLRQKHPFLQSVLVPARTYAGQDQPLHTVGVDLLLACRADLSDDIVYRLSKAYFEELQRLAPATDLDGAPATPIPLHSGAARYYRERALSR